MIESELDPPADKEFQCILCGQSMKVRWHWFFNHWTHASCHDRCVDEYSRSAKDPKRKSAAPVELIPEQFRDWELHKHTHQQAVREASTFDPDSAYRTIAIIGLSGRGKSRLMWQVIRQFFQVLFERSGKQYWPEFFLFTDLVSDYDRTVLSRAKMAKHLYIADIGCVDSFGRERASLQQLIRTRVQKGQWTFLDIDNFSFDPGLEDVLEGLALKVWIKD